MTPTYAWQRFWVPRDGVIDLSDGGFLLDPEREFARYSAQRLATLTELQHFRALALLGEPGIGKSSTLEAEYKALAQDESNHERVFIHVDLRSFSSDILLYNRVFGSPEFVAWQTGNSHLGLYLDSLDEALLRIESVAALLADELPRYPTSRMSIRIACRTAMWPHEPLETAFRKIWGDDAVGAFELAPLRRRDVAEAATAHNINPEQFLQEVQTANAVPFALKPLTLNLLFRIFEKDGHLPNELISLYSQGCLSLCEEQNPSRRGARRLGELTVPQRYRLASRLAAVTMLGNRFAVWTDPEAGAPEEDVRLTALTTGSETGDFQRFDVTDDAVREVLDTGLFSSRGAARMGWAHQSYAEFLAADYLVTKGTSAQNVLKILCHPNGGLIPQLWMVAAWVASRSKEIRHALITREPFALLRGDLVSWSPEDLDLLTAALLTAYEEQRAHDFAIGILNDYSKLAHPKLAKQLRPYIADPTRQMTARRATLMIARACALGELQADLLTVALNPADDPSIRAHAVAALGNCGDEGAKVQLLPLARDQLGPDPNNEIKGQALRILWPAHLTSADLFSLISPPAEGFVGAYVMFLTHELPKSLMAPDLLPALEWATEYVQAAPRTGDFHTKQLADDILVEAWEFVDTPEVMRAFTRYVRAAIQHGHDMFLRGMGDDHDTFRDHIRSDERKRRDFLLAILRSEEPLKVHEAFSFRRPGFLQEYDLPWLLSISPQGSAPVQGINEQFLCDLIEAAFNLDEPSHFEALYDIAMRWAPLHQRYKDILDGILLDSPTAHRLREHHRQLAELESLKAPPVDPPPAERVRLGLERFEGGHLDAWWLLNLDLTLSATSTHYDELQSRITKMRGWATAEEETRRRIVIAAKKYLEDGKPRVGKWLGTSSYNHSDFSAYRAFVLLREVDRGIYDHLGERVWAKWAPVVVAVPKETGTVEGKFHDAIAADALAKAPGEFAGTVQRLIRGGRRRDRAQSQPQPPGMIPFLILRTLDECWSSPTLQNVVYTELKNRKNSPAQCEALLEPLLRVGFAPAREFAMRLLTTRRRRAVHLRSYAQAAATQLLVHCAAQCWPVIWQHISTDRPFGSDLFLKIAHEYRHDSTFYSALTEAQVGDLYVWLEQTFPSHTDPRHQRQGAHWVGPRDSVAHLRDGVLRHLVNLGTETSVEVLRKVVELLRDREWLAYQLLEADQIMRIKTWTPLSPREIIHVTESPSGLLVQSGQELADVLVDALRKYERELHGEQTPVRALWDRQADGSFRPVDENALSDHVRLFLTRELVESGIILNREVEISRVPGAPVGRRTDIKVDALKKAENSETFNTITAVIETKGCWNSELITAMKTQLVDDYLVRLAAPVGIYLVGWFDKLKWDTTDPRRARTRDWAPDDAQRHLDGKAGALPQAFIVRATVVDCHAP
jgi:hypothetical protein